MAIRKIISRSITDGAVVATDVAALSIDSTKLASNAVTNAKIASNAISSDKLDTNIQFGFKNRIINGDMRIDQRNAGASVTPVDLQYTVDRWIARMYPNASKYTLQQNAGAVTPPVGFTNYVGITSSSAYSVASGDYYAVEQRIEGLNTSDLAWGTANAKTVTLSFWVRSSLTGAFGGNIRNLASDNSYPFSYSISAANTWELKTVTIAGPTSGTWLTTNSVGMQVGFSVGTGSSGVGTANTWANAFRGAPTGSTSVVGTSGATFYLTGVQLEVGSSATSFDTRAYGTEFDLCRRYYEQVVMNIGTSGNSTTSVNTSFSWYPKRATPTLGQTGLMGVTLTGVGNYTQTASSVVGAFTPNGGTVTLGNFTGLTAQYSYYANTNLNTNQITVSSEL